MTTTLCDKCQMPLIIGITGQLQDNGTSDPDVLCLNCDTLNVAEQSDYSSDYYTDDSPVRDMDDPQDWIGYAPGAPVR